MWILFVIFNYRRVSAAFALAFGIGACPGGCAAALGGAGGWRTCSGCGAAACGGAFGAAAFGAFAFGGGGPTPASFGAAMGGT